MSDSRDFAALLQIPIPTHAPRTVPGACHAAYMMLPAHMPDAYQATVTSLHDFAASL